MHLKEDMGFYRWKNAGQKEKENNKDSPAHSIPVKTDASFPIVFRGAIHVLVLYYGKKRCCYEYQKKVIISESNKCTEL